MRVVIVSVLLDIMRGALTYLWLSVALSMVSTEIFHTRILRVTGNQGGANEAVIRMLISIGRCVTRSRTRSVSLNGFRQPSECPSVP